MAPMRVKSFAQRHAEEPRTPSPFTGGAEGHLPEINEDDVFRDVVKKLSEYVAANAFPFSKAMQGIVR